MIQSKIYIKLTTTEAIEFQVSELDNNNINKTIIKAVENNLGKEVVQAEVAANRGNKKEKEEEHPTKY